MRVFSILAAIAVTILLAMSILARPQLLAFFGADPVETAPQATDTVVGEPKTEATETPDLVKVMVMRSLAKQVGSGVVLRGQTAARWICALKLPQLSCPNPCEKAHRSQKATRCVCWTPVPVGPLWKKRVPG